MSKRRARAPATELRQSSQEYLADLLREDYESGTVVRAPLGTLRISRKHYAALVGYHPHYMGRLGAEILARYERRLHDDMVAAAHRTLIAAAADGTIEIRGGFVVHRWLLKKIGAPVGAVRRYPKLRKLIESFESELADGSTANHNATSTSKQLALLLHSDDCPLGNNKLSVSVAAVARKLDIHLYKLKEEPFFTQIEERNAQLARGEHLQPGQAIICGRLVDVRGLGPKWSISLLTKLVNSFKSYGDTLSKGAPRERAVAIKLLTFIAKKRAAHFVATLNALNEGRHPKQDDWEKCVFQFREHLELTFQGEESSKQTERKSLRQILQHLAVEGILPALYHRPKSSRRRSLDNYRTKTRTIAEISRPPEGSESAKKVSAEVRNLAGKILRESMEKDEFEDPQTVAFLKVLEQESISIANLLPENVPDAILLVINRRLDAVSEVARKIIKQAISELEVGAKLLKTATLTPASLLAMSQLKEKQERQAAINAWFPPANTEANDAIAKANILSLSSFHFNGLIPSYSLAESACPRHLTKSRIISIVRRFGGRMKLRRLIHPDTSAVSAVIANYLAKSGSNIAVGLTLVRECLFPSETPGFVEVRGIKDRAGGKIVITDFRKNSDVPRDIEWLRRALSPLRQSAPSNERDFLSLTDKGTAASVLNDFVFRQEFKALIELSPALKGLPLLASMLRRSVIVKASLESGGMEQISATIGNHSVSQNRKYNHTMPVLLQRDMRLQKGVKDFESLIIITASNHVLLKGISDDELTKRMKSLVSTGFGTLCADPFMKPGNEGQRCTDATRCAGDGCPQMIIRLHTQEVVRMQLWKASLLNGEAEWERDQPERWKAVWLPFLCLILAIERKASRGPALAAWDAGTIARETLERRPNFKGVQPW